MGHGLAARAAEVEELDHRHLGVSGAEARVAGVGGQQGRIGLGGGVDGLNAGLLFVRLTGGQNLVQHLRVLDQIGAHASAEVAAGQIGGDRYAQRQDRNGQSRATQRLGGKPRQGAAFRGGRRRRGVGACVVGHEGLGIGG
ncbi:hypothetical protein D3C72_1834960 [compost metagenome]